MRLVTTALLPRPFTYHKQFLCLSHSGAQLQVRGYRHGLFHRQVGVQLIVLHDVGGQFTEIAQVSLLVVHRDRALYAGGPVNQIKSNRISISKTYISKSFGIDIWLIVALGKQHIEQ